MRGLLLAAYTCSVFCDELEGFCGDGVCRSPEFIESCPEDCGELLRNTRLIARDRLDPFFWRVVEGKRLVYGNSSEPNSITKIPDRTVLTQSGLSIIPSQIYQLSVDSMTPECLEVFVHTATEVLGSGPSSTFRAPENMADTFVTIRSICEAAFHAISVKPIPIADNKAFKYGAIHDSILGKPMAGVPPVECKQLCLQNSLCLAWEYCPGSEAEGCGGCYLLGRRPEVEAVEIKVGWSAAIERSVPLTSNQSPEMCRKFLLDQSSHEERFYEEKLQKYNDCGTILRSHSSFVPKQVFVGGAHYPTMLVANHRTPEPRYRTSPSDDSPIIPHFFAVPFHDTNIGNVIKSAGAMNIIQSYEMQSLVKPGDVYIDVGANLGSYVIPLAEQVGPSGMVIAFEPFRWLYQLMNANVALNGLMNVWSFQIALSDTPSRQSLLQPNLRFYSSPGGVRVADQLGGMSDEIQKQMYDHEWGLEAVDAWPLDDIIFADDFFTGKNKAPKVSLIKIDVEGMESHVIRGARRVIETFKPVVWSENVDFFEKGDTTFIKLMESMNYVCVKADNAPNDLICKDSRV